MVYCHKCGTKNADDAEYCSKCGTPLKDDERHSYKKQRDECFGLPHGSLIAGLFFGILLILFGISSIYGWDIWQFIGPFIIIFVGILILLGAIYRYRSG